MAEPCLPFDILLSISDYLPADNKHDLATLFSLSLVCQYLVPPCQRRIFSSTPVRIYEGFNQGGYSDEAHTNSHYSHVNARALALFGANPVLGRYVREVELHVLPTGIEDRDSPARPYVFQPVLPSLRPYFPFVKSLHIVVHKDTRSLTWSHLEKRLGASFEALLGTSTIDRLKLDLAGVNYGGIPLVGILKKMGGVVHLEIRNVEYWGPSTVDHRPHLIGTRRKQLRSLKVGRKANKILSCPASFSPSVDSSTTPDQVQELYFDFSHLSMLALDINDMRDGSLAIGKRIVSRAQRLEDVQLKARHTEEIRSFLRLLWLSPSSLQSLRELHLSRLFDPNSSDTFVNFWTSLSTIPRYPSLRALSLRVNCTRHHRASYSDHGLWTPLVDTVLDTKRFPELKTLEITLNFTPDSWTAQGENEDIERAKKEVLAVRDSCLGLLEERFGERFVVKFESV